jgi:hypothetical protein
MSSRFAACSRFAAFRFGLLAVRQSECNASAARALDATVAGRTITLRMPFKSQAQRGKSAQLLVEGKISNETHEEWNRETGGRKLPERVKLH